MSTTVYEDIKVHKLDVDTIEVENRAREDMGDLQDLANSLHETGQINPITIEGNELRAGGRRYAASLLLRSQGKAIGEKLEESNPRRLDVGEILAIRLDELTPMQKLRIELDENKHKNFTDAEEAILIRRIRDYMNEDRKSRGKKGNVSAGAVAKTLGKSKAHVSMGIQVADAIEKEGRKDLLKANSVFGAYTQLNAQRKLEELKKRAAKTKKKSDDLPQRLVQGDALEWISELDDESVDFVHFDPPWGIGVDSYDRHRKYEEWDDKPGVWDDLIKPIIPELYRVLKNDTWAIAWFGIQFYELFSKELTKAGFKVYPVPHIWFKTNKAGSQNDPSRTEMDVYENCFKISKGDPRLFQTGTNVFQHPMPPKATRIHFAQKNVDMLKEMLQRYTFGSMTVIDPTFGSAAALAAAEELDRIALGCEKSEKNRKKAIEFIRNRQVQND